MTSHLSDAENGTVVDAEDIEVERLGPAGVIRLARHEKYNALTRGMMTCMQSVIETFDEDKDVRAIVLTGTDKYFSTGADLNEALEVRTSTDSLRYQRVWRRLDRAIERSPKPVIAAIGGYCVTGGLELVLACDLRVAAENAQFAVTSPRIGSVAGMGATQRLPRLIGEPHAKEMLLMADYVDASTALRFGLVNRVVPTGQQLNEVLAIVDTLAERAPLSLSWHKQAVNSGRGMDLASALDLEASLSAQAFASEDKQEGMSAFLEKRAPHFRGR